MKTIMGLLATAHLHKGPLPTLAACRFRGVDDCSRGVPSENNPYPVSSPEFNAWRDGFFGEWDRQRALQDRVLAGRA